MTRERQIDIWHKVRGVLPVVFVAAIAGSLGLAVVSYRQNWALPNGLVTPYRLASQGANPEFTNPFGNAQFCR